MSSFSDDIGWAGVKGYLSLIREYRQEVERGKGEEKKTTGYMAWVIEVERWKSPLPVILVIKDKKKKKKKKKRPAFVGRLFEMNQKREDVTKKRSGKS